MDIIPNLRLSQTMIEAENKFTANQDKNVNFFVGNEDFNIAKEVAHNLYLQLSNSNLFSEIGTSTSSYDFMAVKDFITDNSYLLLNDKTSESILNNTDEFVADSLSKIFSAFTASSINIVDNDPFLLSEEVYMDYLQKVSALTGFSPKDDLLVSKQDGKYWIMFSGILSDKSVSVSNSNSIKKLFSICDEIQQQNLSTDIVYSGIALHSCESAANSQKEITVIATISLLAIVLLFLFLCKNLQILKLFVISLLLSITTAICSLFIFFKEINIITLIFGTTLCGMCVDYSIHFFVRFASYQENINAHDIRKSLFKSLAISFGSTVICYLLLLFSKYSILKQIAVFSSSGLLSSYITANCLYPYIVKQTMVKKDSYIASRKCGKIHLSRTSICIGGIIIVGFVLISIPHINIKNDISNLYTPSERLMKNEVEASKILGYSSTTYAIITDSSQNAVLEKEKIILEDINDSHIATCDFIPSLSSQEKSLKASKKLLDYLDEQCEILSITDENKNKYREKIENSKVLDYADFPESIKSMASNISLGEINGSFCEVIVFRNPVDEQILRDAFGEIDGTHYFQTAKDISVELDILTNKILVIFAIAILFISVLLFLIYGFKDGLHIMLVPYFMIALTVSLSWIMGMDIDFFYTVGLVLTVGLGLDYVIFAAEKGERSSLKSVLLSFITTELSFGSLCFSSFVPVHIFGIVVFFGLLFAFMGAMLSTVEKE